jgi:hypothetical protein
LELVTILGVLRRRPLAMLLGLVLAAAVAMQLAYEVSLSPPSLASRQVTHGVAWARVLVDTPASQLIDAAPEGGDTLQSRASLLVDLMATKPATAAIAREANLRPERLVVHDPSMLAPSVATPLPERAAAAPTPLGPVSVVAVSVDDLVPIITIRANAADSQAARALVDSTSSTLVQAAAAPADVPTSAIVVERVSPTRAITVTDGRGKLFAAAVGLVLIGMWCTAIVVAAGLLRIWGTMRGRARPLARSALVSALLRRRA